MSDSAQRGSIEHVFCALGDSVGRDRQAGGLSYEKRAGREACATIYVLFSKPKGFPA